MEDGQEQARSWLFAHLVIMFLMNVPWFESMSDNGIDSYTSDKAQIDMLMNCPYISTVYGL
jgi:hypothetical protein